MNSCTTDGIILKVYLHTKLRAKIQLGQQHYIIHGAVFLTVFTFIYQKAVTSQKINNVWARCQRVHFVVFHKTTIKLTRPIKVIEMVKYFNFISFLSKYISALTNCPRAFCFFNAHLQMYKYVFYLLEKGIQLLARLQLLAEMRTCK